MMTLRRVAWWGTLSQLDLHNLHTRSLFSASVNRVVLQGIFVTAPRRFLFNKCLLNPSVCRALFLCSFPSPLSRIFSGHFFPFKIFPFTYRIFPISPEKGQGCPSFLSGMCRFGAEPELPFLCVVEVFYRTRQGDTRLYPQQEKAFPYIPVESRETCFILPWPSGLNRDRSKFPYMRLPTCMAEPQWWGVTKIYKKGDFNQGQMRRSQRSK